MHFFPIQIDSYIAQKLTEIRILGSKLIDAVPIQIFSLFRRIKYRRIICSLDIERNHANPETT